jgi:hypothetical protein
MPGSLPTALWSAGRRASFFPAHPLPPAARGGVVSLGVMPATRGPSPRLILNLRPSASAAGSRRLLGLPRPNGRSVTLWLIPRCHSVGAPRSVFPRRS